MINGQPTGPHVRDVIRQCIGWKRRNISVYVDHLVRGMRFKPNVYLPVDAAKRIMDVVVAQLEEEGYYIPQRGLFNRGQDQWTFTITVGV